jgi:regulation of enolase protein 1 (concanavalin A-like superfamily)
MRRDGSRLAPRRETRPVYSGAADRAVKLANQRFFGPVWPSVFSAAAFMGFRTVVIAVLFAGLFSGQAFAQQSDDFNSCVPDPVVWSFVDPVGDSSASISGIGGVDPKLEINVPAGTSHNPWMMNTAARLMQSVPNSDFSVETKFDSVFDSQYQMQGILVEEAPNVFLRIEFHYTVAGYRGFVAQINDGSATVISLTPLSEEPRYMRVTRTGDDWDVDWAGASQTFMPMASFNHALLVTAMGPYAGNFAATASEFTAVVDYFEVAGSSFPVPDAAALPQDRSLTLSPTVDGTIIATPSQAFYSCDQIVSLDAVPDGGFSFTGWTGDLTGSVNNPESLSMSTDRTVGATFTADLGAPVITGIDIAAGSDEIRTLWTTDLLASSRVEWGLTTAYELGVLDDTNLSLGHDVVVTGLAPETTYHLRLSSTSAGMNQSVSADYEVTTALDPLNVPSGFISDDFNACALDSSLWTAYDPLADSSVSLVGGGTSDAQLRMSIPAGTPHDPWTTNESVRVLQQVADTDLSVELKFDSVLSQGFQMQGLTVQSTPTHYLRLEFYHTGNAQKAFAAIIDNGSTTTIANITVPADQYMRVNRSGDLWSFERSFDGEVWTSVASFVHAMVVTEMGPHAGTAKKSGVVPANDVRVDYAMTTLSPIVTEDLAALAEDKTLAVSIVGAGDVTLVPDKPAYTCGEVVSLTATPLAGNSFGGWSGDLTGTVNPENLVMNADAQVTATFDLIPDPPGLGNVQVSTDSVQESATISWTTMVDSDGFVEYGTSAAYELGSVATSSTSQNHSVDLINLSPGIEYHFRVVATTPTGGNESSTNMTFTIPFLPGQDPSGILTEDFNTCTLDTGLWRVRDPLNDGLVSIQGAGSGNAALLLSVPSGDEHDPWVGDTSLSVVQPTQDTDFSIEAKFDSDVMADLQLQGVMAKESDSRFMRFGVYFDGIGTRALIAQINTTSGSVLVDVPITLTAPYLVQVDRTGDTWDYYVAEEGGAWTLVGSVNRALTISEVGVYGGNSGSSPPGHTTVVDYFHNLSFPLTDEDLGVPPTTVAVTTNVSGMGAVTVAPPGSPYACGTQVEIQANAALGHEFVSWSGDISGADPTRNLTVVEDISVTATFQVDTTPPVLDGFSVIGGPDGAEVRIATNESTNYQVRYGLTAQYELGTLTSSEASTDHQVVIAGLDAETLYHFDIEIEDLAMLTTTTTDQTFLTSGAPGSGPAGLFSDDFNSCAVDPGLWTITDPAQDATFTITGAGAGNAQLRIAVPGGSVHEPWGVNTAPRLVQPVVDADFDVVVRFDSPLTQRFQEQGILVEVDSGNYLRFDFHSDGVDNRIFAGLVELTGNTVLGSMKIPAHDTMLMKVSRAGDFWAQSYSFDGINWLVANQFNHVISPTGVSVFAGNSGSPVPAHTAIIDYFSVVSSPAVPEDYGSVGGSKTLTVTPSGPGVVLLDPDQTQFVCGESVELTAVPGLGYAFDGWSGDLTGVVNPEVLGMTDDRNVTASFILDVDPPVISDVDVSRGPSNVIVTWTTNEPTTSRVFYGLTTSYEMGSADSVVFEQNHTTVITGLDPAETYHLEIEVTDGATFQTTSGDLVIGPAEGPIINVFYGSDQEFGLLGTPQPFVNVLGNVSDADGVASLSYELNGQAPRQLSMGPDFRRLTNLGDFNADIPTTDLVDGANTVLVRATDTLGNQSTGIVFVNYESTNTWPEAYSIDWSTVSAIQDVAQVVDGDWAIENGLLKTQAIGYDRLVGIGDLDWDEYEVEVPVTVHSIDPQGYVSPSDKPLIGMIVRWNGHRQRSGEQPFIEFDPVGGFGHVTFGTGGGTRLTIYTGNGPNSNNNSLPDLVFGTAYIMKLRVEQVVGVGPLYRMKIWESGTTEPSGWQVEKQDPLTAPTGGSALLVAHYADAEFGNVVVTPILPAPPDTTPPSTPTELFVTPLSESSVELSWTEVADDEAMGSYSVYRDGMLLVSGLTTTQYVDSNLADMMQYDYSVVAVDAAGNPSLPSGVFSTETLALGAPTWFDPAWEYRLPIEVDANGTTRVGRYLETDIDFTTALASIGETLALDVNSIRVVRANTAGQVIDANVDFQFDPAVGFDALTNAVGELVIEMAGTTIPTDLRHYDVYFDVVGETFVPYPVADRLTVSNVADEGQNALQIDTSAGSYFLQEQGASLSSLVDGVGQDWISYSVGGGSAGEFRGIPNVIHPELEFHPGGAAGSTAIANQGPLRLRVLTSAFSDTWGATWSFYDDHVSVKIDYVAHDYWFLYEGTPGGLLDPNSDFVTRADGTTTLLNQSWSEDLAGEEWVYFGDPVAQRSLFLAAHEDDNQIDSYYTLNDEMTVFGFGRSGSTPLINTAPRTFSLGLVESVDFDLNSRRVRSIVTDLGITISPIDIAP